MSGIRLEVKSNLDRVVAEFRQDRDEILDKATYRALNRALDKSATETSREIRKVYNVRDRAVKAALTKQRASSKRLWARLVIQGARLGLIEFDASWSRKKSGASVRIKVGGGRLTVRGSFIAARRWRSWQNGQEQVSQGVFKRVGKARYPIHYLRSISIPQAFAQRAVLAAIERLAVEAFDKNLEQQVRYLRGIT